MGFGPTLGTICFAMPCRATVAEYEACDPCPDAAASILNVRYLQARLLGAGGFHAHHGRSCACFVAESLIASGNEVICVGTNDP